MSDLEIPPGYVELVATMYKAAAQWARTHPFAEPPRFTNFERQMAARVGLPPEKVGMVGALLSDVIDKWAANEDTRAFLRHLVDVTNNEATFQQARFLIDFLRDEVIRRGSGDLPPGDWACVQCKVIQKKFTNIDGLPQVPPPDALSVCGECGAIQKVNAEGDGYLAVDEREFNTLPKSVRKTLRGMQAAVKKNEYRKRAQS